MPEQKVIYTQWLQRGLNTFIPTDNSITVPKVEPGLYDIRFVEGVGYYMFKKSIYLDDLLEFPSSTHHKVIDEVKRFYTRKDKFKEYGYAFKRGIMLHGPAGHGKSSLLSLCVKFITDNLRGVVFSLKDERELDWFSKFVPEVFKIIEPHTPIVVCLEDVENLCRQNETLLLNILDGLDQLENVVYLGTTNYIENLKERIINRPSRFDRRIYIGTLSLEDRKFYFDKKLKQSDLKVIDTNRWAEDTDGYSVAHLAELIKSVVIFGNDYNETLELLKEMKNFKKLHSSNYEKDYHTPGFQTTSEAKKYNSEYRQPLQPTRTPISN